jgi:hypothetical protein
MSMVLWGYVGGDADGHLDGGKIDCRVLADDGGASIAVKPVVADDAHGSQQKVLATIDALNVPKGQVNRLVVREQNYFAAHASRIYYQIIHCRGWPIG